MRSHKNWIPRTFCLFVFSQLWAPVNPPLSSNFFTTLFPTMLTSICDWIASKIAFHFNKKRKWNRIAVPSSQPRISSNRCVPNLLFDHLNGLYQGVPNSTPAIVKYVTAMKWSTQWCLSHWELHRYEVKYIFDQVRKSCRPHGSYGHLSQLHIWPHVWPNHINLMIIVIQETR